MLFCVNEFAIVSVDVHKSTLPSSAENTVAILLKGPSPRLLNAPTLTLNGENGGIVSFRKT